MYAIILLVLFVLQFTVIKSGKRFRFQFFSTVHGAVKEGTLSFYKSIAN